METEKSEINWQLICRICLQSSDSDMKYIFGDSSIASDDDIVGKIIKCGGVPVQIEDGMPDRICHQCSIDLEIAFTFRNTCQGSYYQLLKFIKTREIAKDFKLEAEPETEPDPEPEDEPKSELIKVETDFNGPHIFPDADEQQDSLDNVCSPELLIEEIKQNADEAVSDPIKEELPSQNIKKRRSRSKKDKTNGTRGRKPHPISKFICHICGNMYDMQSRLSQHIKRHTVEKEHECEICGKKFAAAAQIPRHMNTHTGNRPYKCQYCPSRFGDSSTRNKHERIHTNERPFKCLQCGKSFAYTNVLKVHMAIHTGDRPYSCSVCGKRFSQRHHQQSHERTHSNFNGRAAKIE